MMDLCLQFYNCMRQTCVMPTTQIVSCRSILGNHGNHRQFFHDLNSVLYKNCMQQLLAEILLSKLYQTELMYSEGHLAIIAVITNKQKNGCLPDLLQIKKLNFFPLIVILFDLLQDLASWLMKPSKKLFLP